MKWYEIEDERERKAAVAKLLRRRCLIRRRGFFRDDRLERRVFCRCEGCRLRYGRVFMPLRPVGPPGTEPHR